MGKGIIQYQEYIIKRDTCYEAFKLVVDNFKIRSGIYPGSYVHITPSLIISRMHYIDNDKKAIKFFTTMEEIYEYVNTNKIYSEDSNITFDGISYWEKPSINEKYDLLISLYSGFISQASKRSLKVGGILLANDSHGDATKAYLDADYEFIGVINDDEHEKTIKADHLDEYFRLKSGKDINIEKVESKMKGPKYKLNSEYYIFRRIK